MDGFTCTLHIGVRKGDMYTNIGTKTAIKESMQVLFGYFFLIGHLFLIGVWLGEDQRTNTIKTHI